MSGARRRVTIALVAAVVGLGALGAVVSRRSAGRPDTPAIGPDVWPPVPAAPHRR